MATAKVMTMTNKSDGEREFENEETEVEAEEEEEEEKVGMGVTATGRKKEEGRGHRTRTTTTAPSNHHGHPQLHRIHRHPPEARYRRNHDEPHTTTTASIHRGGRGSNDSDDDYGCDYEHEDEYYEYERSYGGGMKSGGKSRGGERLRPSSIFVHQTEKSDNGHHRHFLHQRGGRRSSREEEHNEYESDEEYEKEYKDKANYVADKSDRSAASTAERWVSERGYNFHHHDHIRGAGRRRGSSPRDDRADRPSHRRHREATNNGASEKRSYRSRGNSRPPPHAYATRSPPSHFSGHFSSKEKERKLYSSTSRHAVNVPSTTTSSYSSYSSSSPSKHRSGEVDVRGKGDRGGRHSPHLSATVAKKRTDSGVMSSDISKISVGSESRKSNRSKKSSRYEHDENVSGGEIVVAVKERRERKNDNRRGEDSGGIGCSKRDTGDSGSAFVKYIKKESKEHFDEEEDKVEAPSEEDEEMLKRGSGKNATETAVKETSAKEKSNEVTDTVKGQEENMTDDKQTSIKHKVEMDGKKKEKYNTKEADEEVEGTNEQEDTKTENSDMSKEKGKEEEEGRGSKDKPSPTSSNARGNSEETRKKELAAALAKEALAELDLWGRISAVKTKGRVEVSASGKNVTSEPTPSLSWISSSSRKAGSDGDIKGSGAGEGLGAGGVGGTVRGGESRRRSGTNTSLQPLSVSSAATVSSSASSFRSSSSKSNKNDINKQGGNIGNVGNGESGGGEREGNDIAASKAAQNDNSADTKSISDHSGNQEHHRGGEGIGSGDDELVVPPISLLSVPSKTRSSSGDADADAEPDADADADAANVSSSSSSSISLDRGGDKEREARYGISVRPSIGRQQIVSRAGVGAASDRVKESYYNRAASSSYSYASYYSYPSSYDAAGAEGVLGAGRVYSFSCSSIATDSAASAESSSSSSNLSASSNLSPRYVSAATAAGRRLQRYGAVIHRTSNSGAGAGGAMPPRPPPVRRGYESDYRRMDAMGSGSRSTMSNGNGGHRRFVEPSSAASLDSNLMRIRNKMVFRARTFDSNVDAESVAEEKDVAVGNGGGDDKVNGGDSREYARDEDQVRDDAGTEENFVVDDEDDEEEEEDGDEKEDEEEEEEEEEDGDGGCNADASYSSENGGSSGHGSRISTGSGRRGEKGGESDILLKLDRARERYRRMVRAQKRSMSASAADGRGVDEEKEDTDALVEESEADAVTGESESVVEVNKENREVVKVEVLVAEDKDKNKDKEDVVVAEDKDKEDVVVAEDKDKEEVVMAEDKYKEKVVAAEDNEKEEVVMAEDKDTEEVVVAEDKDTEEVVVAEDKDTEEVVVAEDKDTEEVVVAEDKDTEEVVVADDKDTEEVVVAEAAAVECDKELVEEKKDDAMEEDKDKEEVMKVEAVEGNEEAENVDVSCDINAVATDSYTSGPCDEDEGEEGIEDTIKEEGVLKKVEVEESSNTSDCIVSGGGIAVAAATEFAERGGGGVAAETRLLFIRRSYTRRRYMSGRGSPPRPEGVLSKDEDDLDAVASPISKEEATTSSVFCTASSASSSKKDVDANHHPSMHVGIPDEILDMLASVGRATDSGDVALHGSDDGDCDKCENVICIKEEETEGTGALVLASRAGVEVKKNEEGRLDETEASELAPSIVRAFAERPPAVDVAEGGGHDCVNPAVDDEDMNEDEDKEVLPNAVSASMDAGGKLAKKEEAEALTPLSSSEEDATPTSFSSDEEMEMEMEDDDDDDDGGDDDDGEDDDEDEDEDAELASLSTEGKMKNDDDDIIDDNDDDNADEAPTSILDEESAESDKLPTSGDGRSCEGLAKGSPTISFLNISEDNDGYGDYDEDSPLAGESIELTDVIREMGRRMCMIAALPTNRNSKGNVGAGRKEREGEEEWGKGSAVIDRRAEIFQAFDRKAEEDARRFIGERVLTQKLLEGYVAVPLPNDNDMCGVWCVECGMPLLVRGEKCAPECVVCPALRSELERTIDVIKRKDPSYCSILALEAELAALDAETKEAEKRERDAADAIQSAAWRMADIERKVVAAREETEDAGIDVLWRAKEHRKIRASAERAAAEARAIVAHAKSDRDDAKRRAMAGAVRAEGAWLGALKEHARTVRTTAHAEMNLRIAEVELRRAIDRRDEAEEHLKRMRRCVTQSKYDLDGKTVEKVWAAAGARSTVSQQEKSFEERRAVGEEAERKALALSDAALREKEEAYVLLRQAEEALNHIEDNLCQIQAEVEEAAARQVAALKNRGRLAELIKAKEQLLVQTFEEVNLVIA